MASRESLGLTCCVGIFWLVFLDIRRQRISNMQGDVVGLEALNTAPPIKTTEPLSSELLQKHDRLISEGDARKDSSKNEEEPKREPVVPSGAARRAMFQRHSSGGGISQSMSMLPPHLTVDLERKTTPLTSFRDLTSNLQTQQEVGDSCYLTFVHSTTGP